MFTGDKFAGLLTAIAVQFAVIYAGDDYDMWDAYLGMLGLVFGLLYFPEAEEEAWFYRLLVATLLSSSITAIVFALSPPVIKNDEQYLTFGLGMNVNDFSLFSAFVLLFMLLQYGYPKSLSRRLYAFTLKLKQRQD